MHSIHTWEATTRGTDGTWKSRRRSEDSARSNTSFLCHEDMASGEWNRVRHTFAAWYNSVFHPDP